MKRIKVFSLVLGMFLIAACSPAAPSPAAEEPLPTIEPAGPVADPATPPPTAASEASIPDGWTTHTSPQCEYAISYPPEMEMIDQGPYSQLFAVRVDDLEAGMRNFVYVSRVTPDIESRIETGAYLGEVYNHDPQAAQTLLGMQVGESKPLRELPNVDSGFTYQRLPDAQIDGHAAPTFENVRPWEFPEGTKEIRSYVSLDGCTYLIGGYMDTTGSAQAGVIDEELFHQIAATVRLMP